MITNCRIIGISFIHKLTIWSDTRYQFRISLDQGSIFQYEDNEKKNVLKFMENFFKMMKSTWTDIIDHEICMKEHNGNYYLGIIAEMGTWMMVDEVKVIRSTEKINRFIDL